MKVDVNPSLRALAWLAGAAASLTLNACASSATAPGEMQPATQSTANAAPSASAPAPAPAAAARPATPAKPKAAAPKAAPGAASASADAMSTDPRVHLKGGLTDAEQATWNMRLVSATSPSQAFVGSTMSDLAFTGHYVIQGSFDGFQIWDISNPASPSLVKAYVCPASQSDVSVYGNLLFVSGEGFEGRLDCGTEGNEEQISPERLRGIRIFDISDLKNPKYIANVQTCRGSHTHSVLVDPKDKENVYVYVSGSAPVRPEEELPGCSSQSPDEDPNSALFRIEVIKVPLAHPEQAAIVSSPRIFQGLVEAPEHGPSQADMEEIARAKARGAFVVEFGQQTMVIPDRWADVMLERAVEERGGEGPPTAADSATVREQLAERMARMGAAPSDGEDAGPRPGPTQCHDITLYPEIGLAGGACEGYGLLIDISDPVNPKRLAAVADSNFSYWHSATFNNSGTQILFSDEWGGGGAAKCRVGDPHEWGADALFTVSGDRMQFKSYYKMPAPQLATEICVAHNGSLIPIPGRDIMVQAWYEGGISVFDWTDPANPVEIAFFDRGPVDATQLEPSGGPWSVYWYNGVIVSSEIARGLDILELTPSEFLSENEVEAAKTVNFDYFNVQGQQQFKWPATYALAQAYVDQLERSGGLSAEGIAMARSSLEKLEAAPAAERKSGLTQMADHLDHLAGESSDGGKVSMLAQTVRALAQG